MDEAKLSATHEVTARELSQRLDFIETLFNEKLRSRDRALELQASEYERRLEDLNHAHTQAVEVQQTYLRQENYNSQHKDVVDRVGRIEKEGTTNSRVDSLEGVLREKAEALEKTMRDKAEAMERAGRQNMSSLENALRERVDAIDRVSNQRTSSLSKIVYMMMGGLIVIQIILKFVKIP